MTLDYFITNFLVQAAFFLLIGFNCSGKYNIYLAIIMILYQLIVAILIGKNVIKMKDNESKMTLDYFITNFLVQAIFYTIILYNCSGENRFIPKEYNIYLAIIMILYQFIVTLLIYTNVIKLKN